MMSMGTGICLRGRKWYACTSMTVPMEMARASTPLAPLRRTWPSPAPQSNALLTTWSGWAEWKSSPVTGRTAARPPTCTDYGNESRRKNSLPTKGRVIADHPEGPRRRIIIFREQKYIPLLISPVPVVIQRHFPDMVIGCHAGE